MSEGIKNRNYPIQAQFPTILALAGIFM